MFHSTILWNWMTGWPMTKCSEHLQYYETKSLSRGENIDLIYFEPWSIDRVIDKVLVLGRKRIVIEGSRSLHVSQAPRNRLMCILCLTERGVWRFVCWTLSTVRLNSLKWLLKNVTECRFDSLREASAVNFFNQDWWHTERWKNHP